MRATLGWGKHSKQIQYILYSYIWLYEIHAQKSAGKHSCLAVLNFTDKDWEDKGSKEVQTERTLD